MDKNLNYTFELSQREKFNFMSDDGSTGFSSVKVLSEHNYLFEFNNNEYVVKAVYDPKTKTNHLYSNAHITDIGVNPNGIRILGLGDPDFFRIHLNL